MVLAAMSSTHQSLHRAKEPRNKFPHVPSTAPVYVLCLVSLCQYMYGVTQQLCGHADIVNSTLTGCAGQPQGCCQGPTPIIRCSVLPAQHDTCNCEASAYNRADRLELLVVQHRLVGYMVSTQAVTRHSTFFQVDADVVQESLDRLL